MFVSQTQLAPWSLQFMKSKKSMELNGPRNEGNEDNEGNESNVGNEGNKGK